MGCIHQVNIRDEYVEVKNHISYVFVVQTQGISQDEHAFL